MDDADVLLVLGMVCVVFLLIGSLIGYNAEKPESYKNFCNMEGMNYINIDERGNYCITEEDNTLIAKPVERKNGKVYWVKEK